MTAEQHEKNNYRPKGTRTWLYRGMLVSLAAAVVSTAMCGLYGYSSVIRYAHTGELQMRLLFISFIVIALGCILPVGACKPWLEKKWYSSSLEMLFFVGFSLLVVLINFFMELTIPVTSGEVSRWLPDFIGRHYNRDVIQLLVLGVNVLVLAAFFLAVWSLGISIRAIKEMGVRKYLQDRTLVWQLCRFIKTKLQNLYQYFVNMDITRDSLKTIRKLVLANALILTLISVTWLVGLYIVAIYSVVLYLLLKKYFGDIQKRYGILLKAVDEMAEGNLNVAIEEELGIFEPFKPQIMKIQDGIKKAVSEEVKSQRMKAELITNVSHDLKTPLTAIITYVNLLKDPDLTQEQRREYLDTLERKSLRLKVLIEDLFEVSKANSGNVTLNPVPVDIMNLIKQVSVEMKDKMAAAELDIRINLTDERVLLSLDSEKTYRIYENLFSNVAKYALPGTRVYVNGSLINDTVVISIKNISAQELNVNAADLTERFVRGDTARNTEGSGLGLAIAKSFTELQGGKMQLEVDGDLFKVTTVWKV